MLRIKGNFLEAKTYSERAFHGAQHIYGKENGKTARMQCNYALALKQCGEKDQAHELLQSALVILENKLGTEHKWTKECREALSNNQLQ